ncbi:MAG: trehalose-6-phosphate synthase [Gammaproteobacteria bacterium]|nr:trehalose-6-phosphate synthase [Gammaproteobacteria bacterium]
MSRLVAVSNRVALPGKRGSAAGGLATGLLAAMHQEGGLWFGWNGNIAEKSGDLIETFNDDNINYATMPLTRREFENYYLGFSNSVLWPLCHSRLNLLRYSRPQYDTYLGVNQRLVRLLLPQLKHDDLIWVHDYHFIPFGALLRAAGIKQCIGFFLHVPFPSPDVLRALPVYVRMLNDLLQYDLLGFQTDIDVQAFLGAVQLFIPEARVHGDGVQVDGRTVAVRAFPIGIEVDEVARMSKSGRQGLHGRRLQASLTGRKLIIGVDRLDYSKGLPERIRAYGRFLEMQPEFHRQVVLLQIAPLSRTEVPEYEDIRSELNAIAGDIHARFAEYDWLPLRYMTRGFQRGTIMGFLSLARVALVTPLRDGMNLVAKEYIAAQSEEDPGVLLLSSLAGAAQELKDAIIVNPYDIDGVAAGLGQALTMPLEERRMRWSKMLAVLRSRDIYHWVAEFLEALRAARPT